MGIRPSFSYIGDSGVAQELNLSDGAFSLCTIGLRVVHAIQILDREMVQYKSQTSLPTSEC